MVGFPLSIARQKADEETTVPRRAAPPQGLMEAHARGFFTRLAVVGSGYAPVKAKPRPRRVGHSRMMTFVLGGAFSVIGMAAFAYGRKSKKSSPLIGGMILMIFPYFVPNPLLMVLVGAVTLVGMYLFPE